MRINHNIQAINTYNQLAKNQSVAGKNMEKLSSGLRINSASDDAAGLAISEKMRSQIRGLQQAERNTMDGVSLIQTVEGVLTEVNEMIQRMRELAVQAATDTNTDSDREDIQQEVDQLELEIDRISKQTEFNTKNLLNTDNTFTLQIGANADQVLDIVVPELKIGGVASDENDPGALGIEDLDFTNQDDASIAIGILDHTLKKITSLRSKFGAYQNRLEHTVNNIKSTEVNLTSAESRIRDVDMAREMSEFTKNNILNQSAQAMLAQANQLPQGILQLLQG